MRYYKSKTFGKNEEQLPQETVGRLLVNSRPTVGQQLANRRPTVSRQSANSWPTVGRLSADRHLPPFMKIFSQQSAVCRPTVGSMKVICRPSVG